MSCDSIHSSFLFAWASLIMCVSIEIGSAIDVLGIATWLCLLRIGYLQITLAILVVIIFVNIFFICSMSDIGRVCMSLPVNFGFFEIGNMLACFHIFGICFSLMQALKISSST